MGIFTHSAKEQQKNHLQYFRVRMKEKKITLKEMSQVLEVSYSTVRRWFEKNDKNRGEFPCNYLFEICEFLKISVYLDHEENTKK